MRGESSSFIEIDTVLSDPRRLHDPRPVIYTFPGAVVVPPLSVPLSFSFPLLFPISFLLPPPFTIPFLLPPPFTLLALFLLSHFETAGKTQKPINSGWEDCK